MTERFANQLLPLTLANPAGSGDPTVTLGGAFAGLPSTGTFRLLFVDPLGIQPSEIAICTARSAGVCTVTRGAEGTSAAAWSTSTVVINSFTAGAIAQLISDIEAAIPEGPAGAGPSGSTGIAAAGADLTLAGDVYKYLLPCPTSNKLHRFKVYVSVTPNFETGSIKFFDFFDQEFDVTVMNEGGVLTIGKVFTSGPNASIAMATICSPSASVETDGSTAWIAIVANANNLSNFLHAEGVADRWVRP